MDYHKNARLTVSLREELGRRFVAEGLTFEAAGVLFHVSDTVAYVAAQPTVAVTYVLNGVSYLATRAAFSSPETCSATVPAATIGASACGHLHGDGQSCGRQQLRDGH